MSKTMDKKAKKDYKETRTAWKYFSRQLDIHHDIPEKLHDIKILTARILVQILKELQYQND